MVKNRILFYEQGEGASDVVETTKCLFLRLVIYSRSIATVSSAEYIGENLPDFYVFIYNPRPDRLLLPI